MFHVFASVRAPAGAVVDGVEPAARDQLRVAAAGLRVVQLQARLRIQDRLQEQPEGEQG